MSNTLQQIESINKEINLHLSKLIELNQGSSSNESQVTETKSKIKELNDQLNKINSKPPFSKRHPRKPFIEGANVLVNVGCTSPKSRSHLSPICQSFYQPKFKTQNSTIDPYPNHTTHVILNLTNKEVIHS